MSKITRNKKILGGKPIIEGTRISVEVLWDAFYSSGILALRKFYPQLSKKEIKTAINYHLMNYSGDEEGEYRPEFVKSILKVTKKNFKYVYNSND